MAPLYAKLRTEPYHSILHNRETTALGWRAAALPNMEPRVATPQGDRVESDRLHWCLGKVANKRIVHPAPHDVQKYKTNPPHNLRTDGSKVEVDLRIG